MFDHEAEEGSRSSGGLQFGRRAVLRGGLLGAAGLAAAALIGCSGSDEAKPSGTAGTGGGTQAASNVDMGDDQRGRLVRDPSLPYPYNFPEPKKEAKPGGIVRAAVTWDVGPLDPTVSAAGGTVAIGNMAYNRLLGLKRGPQADPFKVELQPELAQSWERSPDGLTYTFKIDPRAKWQNLPPLNGRAFVAEDARYALERYSKEGANKSYYVNVASFSVPDPQTLKITMTRPVADFLNPIGSDKQSIFPRELVDSGEIVKKAIGTGPMIVKEAVGASHVTLETNRDYWRRKVLVDGAEFRIMPDPAARLAAFRTGQVDHAGQLVDTLSSLKQLEKSNSNIQVNMIPLTYVTYTFGMNLNKKEYQDERVRRALSMAINRQQIIVVTNEGLGKALHVIHWPYVFADEPTVQSGKLGAWMKYDPNETKKLLAAAGAEKITMNNSYYAYTASNDKVAELLVPMLRDVGINLTGGKVDYNEFNGQWTTRKLQDVTTTGWIAQGFDPDGWFYGHVHSKSPGNRWNMSDPQIDQWAEQQQAELNPQARQEIFKKIWDRDLDMMYRPPLPGGFSFEVYQPWLRGVRWGQASPSSNSSFYVWGMQLEQAWLDK